MVFANKCYPIKEDFGKAPRNLKLASPKAYYEHFFMKWRNMNNVYVYCHKVFIGMKNVFYDGGSCSNNKTTDNNFLPVAA